MRKLKYSFIAFCFLIISILSVDFLKLSSENESLESANSSNALMVYEEENIKTYFKNTYGASKVINVTENSDAKKMIPGVEKYNFDQIILNNYYNENNTKGRYITGTCAMVACTELVMYYGKEKKEFNVGSVEYEFMKIYESNNEGWNTSKTHGTWRTLMDLCVSNSFYIHGSDRTGTSNSFYLWNNIIDSVNGQNDPIIYNLNNHSVLVAGLTEIKATITHQVEEGWWFWEKHLVDKTEIVSEEFVIICEGWGRDSLSLLPRSSIGSYWNGNQVTWAIN